MKKKEGKKIIAYIVQDLGKYLCRFRWKGIFLTEEISGCKDFAIKDTFSLSLCRGLRQGKLVINERNIWQSTPGKVRIGFVRLSEWTVT
jgi:hypothetical protein